MPLATILCTLLTVAQPGLEVQVDGGGLLRFAREGRAVYAKKATLVVTSGRLTAGGCDLLPAVNVPSDTVSIDVDLEGNLFAVKGAKKAKIGKLVLALFSDEGALTASGKFLVAQTRPALGEAGQDLFGVVRKSSAVAADAPKVVVYAPEPEKAPALPALAPLASPTKPATSQAATNPTPNVSLVPAPKAIVAPYKAAQKIKGELPVISIRTDNVAKGDRILLGEVADVTGDPQAKQALENIAIGDTPSMGVTRGLDAITVTSALTRVGWKVGAYVLNMVPGATVKRQCQEVSDEKFVQAAIDGARSQLKIASGLHSDIAQPPFSCPMGEVSLKVESCNESGMGAKVSVAVYVDGKRINARMIQLSPDKDAVVISKGQRVKVIAHAAGASVELNGKAKDRAWAGQQVTVETDTGAVLTGTVTSEGAVEVSL